MMFRRPPALADWLLERLGYTRENAALIGDLLEEFRNGRSAGWYWRQTLAVIANGFQRHAAPLAPYWSASFAGYAVQFFLSYALWSRGFPRLAPGSAWVKAGIYVAMQAAAWLVRAAPVRGALGQWTAPCRLLFLAAEPGSRKRATILALTGYDSFSLGLWSYCLCAVVFWRFSETEFVGWQAAWFVLWVLAPAVLATLAAPATADAGRVEDREPWLAIPQREPVLTVALPDGRAIPLVRDRLAESIFEAADPELIRVAFGGGKSLELLRRAVWLGGYQSRSHILGRVESLTLAELGALLRWTPRTARVETAPFDSHRPGLWERWNRAFRGDPM